MNTTREITFADLPIGAQFKFFEGGSLLTKTGKRSYEAPQWGHHGLTTEPEKKAIPVQLTR